MAKKPFQNGKSEMSARELVLSCAMPAVPGESRKAALLRAAEYSGLTYARILAFFYGKGNPPPEAREKLEQAAAARLAEIEYRQRTQDAWNDMARRRRIAELEAELERLKRDETVASLDRKMAYQPADFESRFDFDAR